MDLAVAATADHEGLLPAHRRWLTDDCASVFSPCVDGATEAAALGLHACWGVTDRAIGGFPPPGLVVMVASMLQRSSGMTCALRVRAVDDGAQLANNAHPWRVERNGRGDNEEAVVTPPGDEERDDTATLKTSVRLPLVFGPDATDDDVFRRVGAAAVHEALFKGRSRAFVAYGVTGRGKHHTMDGLMLRSLAYVFEQRDSHRSLAGVRVKLEAVDSYLGDLVDMVDDASTYVHVREHPPDQVVLLDGAKSVECTSLAQVQREVLDVAQSNRDVRISFMGSRTNGYTQIVIAHLMTGPETSSAAVVNQGRLMFVVLGEWEVTKFARQRTKREVVLSEAVELLLKCCSAARDGAQLAPYRDSPLTHLLSPAFRRQGSLCMIFNAEMANDDDVDTLQRAKLFESMCCGPPRPPGK